jgi:peptide/nickel transport system permease protein
VLLAVTVIISTWLQFTPGDPLDAYAPPDQVLTEERRAALERQLGLDRPLPVQYVHWLREAASGNLGYRSKNFRPVLGTILDHLPPTLWLMALGLTVGIVVGIGFGIIVAVRPNTFLDSLFSFLSFLGISTPAYLAALIALYVFSLKLEWFPVGGVSTPGGGDSFADRFHHLVLPAFVLSINQVAVIMRYTRSSMLGVLRQDYVRTARAKGAREYRVVGYHALRNALIPVVTVIGANIPVLLGGAVFIESVFSWPGMGLLFLDGVYSRDYPLIMGMTLILAIAVLVVNLLTDIAYAVINPRIRYGG